MPKAGWGRDPTRQRAATAPAPIAETALMAHKAPLPTLVMLPGTLCDGRVFTRQKQALRGFANVVIIDYQGLRDLRQWAPQLLQKLPCQFSVAGFSLGGLWALELLRQAPQRVQRIAMIASNAQAASPPGQRKSAWLWKMWRDRGPGEVAKHVKPGYFHHERNRRAHAVLVHDMAMGTPRQVAFAEFAWAAQRPDGLAALAAFEGPLLLVSGEKDRLCPPSMQRAMLAAQPSSTWLELPRVGHFVPLEAPAQLNRALQQWMAL
jgi:pimeloyl-ACP methyl ester carboxylesterase